MLDTQNQGPQCAACNSPMKLTAIEPSALGQDLRTFTCPEGAAAYDRQCCDRGLAGAKKPSKKLSKDQARA
jgi:hypothetical protein